MESTLHYIGQFQLNNEVVISDPSYILGIWCQGELDNVKPGTWKASVRTADMKEWGTRVAELIVHHLDFRDLKKWNHQKAFKIGVDSGQAGFFQKASFKDKDELKDWYDICCQLTDTEHNAGLLPNGVVSGTGYGDGVYDLYTIEKDDQIVAMKLIFIDEDEYKDDFDKKDEEEPVQSPQLLLQEVINDLDDTLDEEDEADQRLLNKLKKAQELLAKRFMPTVVIHVSGGVAETVQTNGADVFILDFDHFKETEFEMGSHRKGYVCPACGKDNTEFEWNAATVHRYDETIFPIQKEGTEDEPNHIYVCAYCFEESLDIKIKKHLEKDA